MTFEVLLSSDAERDMEDLYRFVTLNDSPAKAEALLSVIEAACLGLAEMPQRGNIPKELERLGIAEFRELHHKPYRVIYRIRGCQVVIYCILDGRRDMQTLLQLR
ncbi:plasmid stabilization protein [Magnetospirillum sp. ME-1]|uniref:type II toxin-antitoxin system RelE/ParE family toxin n=1 Tax=Magnetospirillum sp. ME-1 TaxID=1639348 RepID=UPI000A17E851|nr:type II toxin-antitoxin system RelE/ParE family toxin [Magnetospirillum sp. ME-1]ARJ66880.1 plasmid stabilization protein [Magnetospirillum sp. ME-1]